MQAGAVASFTVATELRSEHLLGLAAADRVPRRRDGDRRSRLGSIREDWSTADPGASSASRRWDYADLLVLPQALPDALQAPRAPARPARCRMRGHPRRAGRGGRSVGRGGRLPGSGSGPRHGLSRSPRCPATRPTPGCRACSRRWPMTPPSTSPSPVVRTMDGRGVLFAEPGRWRRRSCRSAGAPDDRRGGVPAGSDAEDLGGRGCEARRSDPRRAAASAGRGLRGLDIRPTEADGGPAAAWEPAVAGALGCLEPPPPPTRPSAATRPVKKARRRTGSRRHDASAEGGAARGSAGRAAVHPGRDPGRPRLLGPGAQTPPCRRQRLRHRCVGRPRDRSHPRGGGTARGGPAERSDGPVDRASSPSSTATSGPRRHGSPCHRPAPHGHIGSRSGRRAATSSAPGSSSPTRTGSCRPPLLTAPVSAPNAARSARGTRSPSTTEAVVRPGLVDLAARRPFGVALVHNHDDARGRGWDRPARREGRAARARRTSGTRSTRSPSLLSNAADDPKAYGPTLEADATVDPPLPARAPGRPAPRRPARPAESPRHCSRVPSGSRS